MASFHEVFSAGWVSNDGLEEPGTEPAERRKRVRTTVHWPVLFFPNEISTEGIESITVNLSSEGFYCLSRTLFTAGETLFCTLRVPSHDAGGHERDRILECRVCVKRAEPSANEGMFGVACEIIDYHFLGSQNGQA
jgi:hypothetical protein